MKQITFRLISNQSVIAVLHKMPNDNYLCYNMTKKHFFECCKDNLINKTTSAMHYNIAQLCDELYRCINVLEYKIVNDIW